MINLYTLFYTIMFIIVIHWFFSDTCTIARNNAKISENTLDLSTTELSEATKNLYHVKKHQKKEND